VQQCALQGQAAFLQFSNQISDFKRRKQMKASRRIPLSSVICGLIILLMGTFLLVNRWFPGTTVAAQTSCSNPSATPSVGATPLAIAKGNFDQDNFLDLAVLTSSGLQFLRGNGSGQFKACDNPNDFKVWGTFQNLAGLSGNPVSLVAGDFIQPQLGEAGVIDRTDLAVAFANSGTAGTVAIFRVFTNTPPADPNNQIIVNAVSIQSNLGAITQGVPGSLVAGDFERLPGSNPDSLLDLAIVAGNEVKFLRNDGSGNFSSPSTLPSSTGAYSLAVGNFNNHPANTKDDLAVVYRSESVKAVKAYLNNGNFDFTTLQTVTFSGFGNDEPISATASNFVTRTSTGEHPADDLAFTLGSGTLGSSVKVAMVQEEIIVERFPPLPTSTRLTYLAAGDFNGDGISDLAATTNNDTVAVYKSAGNGSFVLAANGVNPVAAVAGKFVTGSNLDSLAVANKNSNNVAILSPTFNLQFFPLPKPVRLLDTRPGATGCDAPDTPIAANGIRTQITAGRTCDGITIPSNALAVTGNITTVNSGGGYLTLYPSDATQPLVASTNYTANEIVNNVFTVGLGALDGAFNIFAVTATDVVVDVTGYYAPPGTGGLYFHPLPTPIRLLETRSGQTVGCDLTAMRLAANSTRTQQARTTCSTIPSSAKAIVGNATVVGPNATGYLTLYPSGASQPLVASGNYTTGAVVNTPFTVGLEESNGTFNIYTTAETDLVIDVLGYYSTDPTNGLYFNPLAHPVRLLETRSGQTVGCYLRNAALTGGAEYEQAARGTCDGLTIPTTALGIVGNATIVPPHPNGGGYLTLWPSGVQRPLVATSNFNAGQIVNRHFIVGLGATDGAFKIFSSNTTELVIDVSGYFAP
jgi:hypothetical protein